MSVAHLKQIAQVSIVYTLPFIAKDAMLACMTTDESLIGTTEAQQLLGVSKDTLIRMIARGELAVVHKLPAKNGAYVLSRTAVMTLAETMRAAS